MGKLRYGGQGFQEQYHSMTLNTTQMYYKTYHTYMRHFHNLSKILFTYENVPDSIPADIFEEYLADYGMCGLYDDKYLGLIFVPANPAGGVNIYNEYTKYQLIAPGYQSTVGKNDVVIFKYLPESHTLKQIIDIYVQRITYLKVTIDINIYAQRTPIVLLVDERQRMTWENILKRYDNFNVTIKGEKSLGLDLESGAFKILDLKVPLLTEGLHRQYLNEMSEILAIMGINYTAINKTARLTTDEANTNVEYVTMNYMIMYNQRKKSIAEANKKYGLNIKVYPTKFDSNAIESVIDLYAGTQNIDSTVKDLKDEADVYV